MSEPHDVPTYTVFDGPRRIAAGTLPEAALAAKRAEEAGARGTLLVFADATGRVVDIHTEGTDEEVVARHSPRPHEVAAKRGPGRPRLGVVAREVTLLPRHWDWLNGQPGGASVALRKLVDEARRQNAGADRTREAREAAYRFTNALAGDLPGFEEATRALFAGDRARVDAEAAAWPSDVRDHALRLGFPTEG